jgi:protein-S-isoprenylcysteine O-methyltransferase Ste14
MSIAQSIVITVPWLLWLAYWIATAQAVKATARKETRRSRTWQAIPLIVGGALVILPDPVRPALLPDMSSVGYVQFAGFAMLVAGLLFSVWARVHLGTNWSVSVTLKDGHELIRTGPYALVRHPIYTGCLVALIGSAMIGGTWRGALGVALIFASLACKVRVEENWLTGHFGEAYVRYRREVAALIPGIY